MSSNKFSTPSHLTIVCCHGIWLGNTPDERNWLIQDFQAGETPTFIEHIKMGLRLLVGDEPGTNVLMFSGAATRPESHISESESYLSLAQSQSFFGIITGSDPRTHQSRLGALTPRSKYTPYMIAETRALDSFQNLSLSLEAFRNLYGAKPETVTVVSHEFKRARFEELHFKVLQEKYASTEFHFEGQDPPYMVEGSPEYDPTKAQKVRHAEKAKGYDMWAKDPQGSGEEVMRKRKERDFWGAQFHVGEDRERPENLTEIIHENGMPWSEQLP